MLAALSTGLVILSAPSLPFLRSNHSALADSVTCPSDFEGAGCNGNCPSCCPVGGQCSCGNCDGCCVAPEEDKCLWTSPSGTTYNFTGSHPVGQDWSAPGESVLYTYHYNFCQGTNAYSGAGSSVCAEYETAVCQQFEQRSFTSVGQLASVSYSELESGSGVEAVYLDATFTTTVVMLCDPDAISPVFYPVAKIEGSENAYNMTIRTAVGCPSSGPGPTPPGPTPPAPTPPMPTCELKAPSGRNYDLAALQTMGAFEANMTSFDTGVPIVYDLFVGVCSTVPQCSAVTGAADAAACQVNRVSSTDGPYDQGNLNSMTMVELPQDASNPPVTGVRIEYTDGSSPCWPDDNPRRTIVDLYCNKAAATPTMRWIAEDPVCTLHVAIETAQACPIP